MSNFYKKIKRSAASRRRVPKVQRVQMVQRDFFRRYTMSNLS